MKLKEIDYGLSGIYKLMFDNNKIYIGLSNDIRRRINEHLRRDVIEYPNLLISKAFKKHRLVDIEILELIDENDREKLKDREKYWIQFYNSFKDRNKGYNMTEGGDGAPSGIYNPASNISQENLDLIYDLLKNSTLTYEEIADKSCSSYSIVSRINNGIHYHNSQLEYPIRKSRVEHFGIENKHSSFYNREEELLQLIKDLQDNILTYEEIKGKYKIQTTTLSLINQGKKYRQNDCNYPLREIDKGKAKRRIFTEEELIFIKDKLSNSQMTMGEISQAVKCDRKIISEINSGKRQSQINWDYPLRKTPLKTGPKSF